MNLELFPGLPSGTTHIAISDAYNTSGCAFNLTLYAFKYEAGTLKTYTTDSDGEYGSWREAIKAFYKIPKIFPLEIEE